MSTNNRIQSIYKARRTITKLLGENQGFDVSDYNDFSINEVDTMYKNNQLDMLVENEERNIKTYIRFYLDSKQLRPQNLDNIIEDLFTIEEVLTKDDTLVVITDEEPNDTIIAKVKYLFDRNGIFVVMHNISRLQFNILDHDLVPVISILDDEEKTTFMKDYNIRNTRQLPELSRFDPQALAISLRPGDICKIERDSATALKTNYYRICV